MFNTPFAFMAAPAGGGPLLGNRLALDAGIAASYSGSGSSWFDLSGNSNTVTLFNSPTYSSLNGGSLVFDGSTQYGTAPDSSSLDITGNNISIEYWIKPTSGDFIIVSKSPFNSGPTNQNGNYMLWHGNAYKYFTSIDATGVFNNLFGNNPNTNGTNWQQVVFVYDNLTPTWYFNGAVLPPSQIGNGPNPLVATTEPLQIGRRADGYGYYSGNFSVLNIWDYALTAGEISDNYDYYSTRY
jgi:hypothetical protein